MSEHYDVAIIGAGVSGVYSAWKLKKNFPGKRIAVFEGSDRVGGRLLSVKAPDVSNMVAELGGMRILDAQRQPLIHALLNEINQFHSLADPIEFYPFPVDTPVNIAFLRDVRLRLKDYQNNPHAIPYNTSPDAFAKTPGAVIIEALDIIVPGITNPDLTEKQRREMTMNADFNGKKLYEQGFWNVLQVVMTSENYHYCLDAGGYNSTMSNWNAADAIPWFLTDFGDNVEYFGFKQGFQSVPLTLAEEFQTIGGELLMGHKLSSFEQVNGVFSLNFTTELDITTFDEIQCTATHIVLAMPRRSLDLLEPSCPVLQQPAVKALTGSVTPRPLFKLFTTYQSPWWVEQSGIESGRSVTDMPVRQTYYWPTNQGQPALDGPAILMASYDDGVNVGFWDGYRQKRGLAWKQQLEVLPFTEKRAFTGRLLKQQSVDPQWAEHEAPAAMVTEVTRQIDQMHDVRPNESAQTQPLQAAFRDWGDDPYGGGWNSWNIGVQSDDVANQIVQPLPQTHLYICGEAYSHSQGWVEGALQTADLMLVKLESQLGA
ncbi:FAD-dependent oxidoreductase (plasmid) [Photobacterium sp. GJ3]|uniref:flavin monoamine oxidase family protein n=1 Tax=Photobacterium sp. GJ3 TaxID=2829502 RepID=UPI001B8C44B4|nr:FAD-dependent oxidoreductase [Photobacterium sp. GJ3]QUJ69629.1 FAD-dependent oxidoreductase [Photobacterium sp. GJ3]